MPIELKEIYEQLRKLPIISPKYCDSCGAQHSEQDYRFVTFHDGAFIFQINCQVCSVGYMLRVSPAASGMAAQRLDSLNVDLSLDELKKFAGKPRVKREEALEVYTEMRKVKTIDDYILHHFYF